MISNRGSFLDHIASRLGRERNTSDRPVRNWKFRPQDKMLIDKTPEELMNIFRAQCQTIHTDLIETTAEELSTALQETVQSYGNGPIILWNDPRFDEYGLRPLMNDTWPEQKIEVNEWDYTKRENNIKIAERANIGITFSDMTLAETATVVLFSSKEKGRAVSLLPQNYIAIIPKSTIVPRMTQAAREISRRIRSGETVPSCINFITGPSNSGDIEMKLVVGVHGPVKTAYIVVEDR